MISYAQNFEDVMAARLFPPEYRGFYVDIGAADPTFLSVTKHFYDSGWNGINVEPLGQAHQKLVEARPRDINLNLVVGRESGPGSFFEILDYQENSTTDEAVMQLLREEGHTVRSHNIEMLSLLDLCERYVGSRPIDFMKIDVEGGELSVIEGADWTKYRPVLLIIEAVVVNSREENWAVWEPAVRKAGYEKVHFDGLNNFYLRKESRDLKEKFRLPPNLFDGFEVLRPDQHAAQLADSQAYHAALIEDLSAKLNATETQGAQQQAKLKAALAAAEGLRAGLEQEHAKHVGAGAELAADLRQQLYQARADSAWLRDERRVDALLLREQVNRNSAVTEDMARQHGLLLAKSEEHAVELRRHLEREVDLASRIAGAETSLHEREKAADAEREHAAHRLATAKAECERTGQQLAAEETLASKLAPRLATAEAERERISQQLATALTLVNELEPRLATAQADKERTRQQLATVEKTVSNLQSRLTTAETDKERTSQQLATTQMHLSKLEPKLATAEAERADFSQQFETAADLVAKLDARLAEQERLLRRAKEEADDARAVESSSRLEQSKLSEQLAATVALHCTKASEMRDVQRWFEQTLVERAAAARTAESALRTSHAELLDLRHQVLIANQERDEQQRHAEDAAANQAAAYAQLRYDHEIRLEEASSVWRKSRDKAITMRDAWLNEGRALLHTLRAEREPSIIRLARELVGRRERERQAEFGDSIARWSAAAADFLDVRASSTMDVNMTDEKRAMDTVRRAASLDELLFLADRAFIRCAFLTLLGREIDPEGEAYYLSRLRRGYAKIALLKQLRRSAEGRQNDPGIAGLDRAIARYRRANLPMVGWAVRQFNGEEGDGAAARRLRAIENRIGVLQNQFGNAATHP